MKRIVVFLCILLLFSGCAAEGYTCRVIADAATAMPAENPDRDPPIPAEELTDMMEKTLRRHLRDCPQPIRYEVMSRSAMIAEGEEIFVYWLSTTDADGFNRVVGLRIQKK